MKYVFLDIETTGLNPKKNKIIELSALKVDQVTKKKELFHQLFNPGKKLSQNITSIIQLDNSLLKKQPRFKDQAKNFLEFIKESKIVGFNNAFLFSFLDQELIRAGYKKIMNKKIDLYHISKKRFPKEVNTVDFLTRALNIQNHTIDNKPFFEVVLLEEIFKRLI